MERRAFLHTGGALSVGLAFGCAPLIRSPSSSRRRYVALEPVRVAADRVIRTTVGLRPHRDSGFVVRAERLDDRMLVHNYGHGGAGMSLSWGTAHLAADLALQHTERRAAVIGCGVVGLTTARILQRRGFDVTIYAMAVPPETTSNMSWASFTPLSGLVAADRRTPAWDAQFRAAAGFAYRELQLLVGRQYGIAWLDEYSPTNSVATGSTSAEAGRVAADGASPANALLPENVILGRDVLEPGEHPFSTRYARRRPTLRFEPSVYLDALMRDVLVFGSRIVVRRFDSPRDLLQLTEPVVVNCTGLGAKQLFGDDELTPVKGQLVVLLPQPDVNYIVNGMLPRSDGIALGHTMQRGEWSLDVDEAARTRIIEQHVRFFATMRPPPQTAALQPSNAPPRSAVPEPSYTPAEIPPLESFFDRES